MGGDPRVVDQQLQADPLDIRPQPGQPMAVGPVADDDDDDEDSTDMRQAA